VGWKGHKVSLLPQALLMLCTDLAADEQPQLTNTLATAGVSSSPLLLLLLLLLLLGLNRKGATRARMWMVCLR